MENLIKAYEKKIENATIENDLKNIMIGISQDCSAYKLSWEAFLNLRKQVKAKGAKIGSEWTDLC